MVRSGYTILALGIQTIGYKGTHRLEETPPYANTDKEEKKKLHCLSVPGSLS